MNIRKDVDKVLFTLDAEEKWALGYDPQQWMIMRARKRREERYWQPVSFIGSCMPVLMRVLAEKGVQLTPEAGAALDAMPSRFLDWYRQKRQGTG